MTGAAFILLAGSAPAFFTQLTLLVVASAAFAYICYRLGLQPIVGFLLTGVLIGPSVLGLVQDPELINAAAEVGVILLLFTIGIEFSLAKLARVKKLIFLGGGMQVTLVVAVVVTTLLVFGVDIYASLFTACLIALSSTAIVMKLLADRGETDTQGGQFALSVLIFQDLAVVGMVMLVPILGGMEGSAQEIAWALVKALAMIGFVVVLARHLMPKLLEAVARTCSEELFLLTLVAVCFGTAYLTSMAGVSLSLGAFLAGIVVSESRFSDHAVGEILPLQILFSAAFFVSVGLLLDVHFLLQNAPLVLAVVGGVLLLKLLTTGVSALALGFPLRTAVFSGLLLAQVGEFSFVLERAGRDMNLFPAGMADVGAQTFIAATVVLMVATPLLAQLGGALEKRLTQQEEREQRATLQPGPALQSESANPLRGHVLIGGYGSGGEKLARVIQEAKLPYLILTLSPGGANRAEAAGRPVLRGDYTRLHTLKMAGIEQARMLVVPDDEPATAGRVVSVARSLRPDLLIFVRTPIDREAGRLVNAGADGAVSDENESVVRLLHHILYGYGVEPVVAEQYARGLRSTSAAAQSGARRLVPSGPISLSEQAGRSVKCSHLDQAREVAARTDGCEECLKQGDRWVHLRICLGCGHVGCCDSSRNKHATKHFQATGHPIVRSLEPGEDWAWCFVDQMVLGD